MAHLTPDEVRAKNIDAMGAECGALYTHLVNEILWLHVVWRQYRALFGTSPDRAAGAGRRTKSTDGVLSGEVPTMKYPIRLFQEEDEPEEGHTQKIVREVGLALAAPVLASGLCPVHERQDDEMPPETHWPLAPVSRLAFTWVASGSATPFFASYDGSEAVTLHYRERRHGKAWSLSSSSTFTLS